MKRPAEEEAPSLQRASLLIIILLPRFHPLLRSFLPAFTSKSIVAEPDGSAPFISLYLVRGQPRRGQSSGETRNKCKERGHEGKFSVP